MALCRNEGCYDCDVDRREHEDEEEGGDDRDNTLMKLEPEYVVRGLEGSMQRLAERTTGELLIGPWMMAVLVQAGGHAAFITRPRPNMGLEGQWEHTMAQTMPKRKPCKQDLDSKILHLKSAESKQVLSTLWLCSRSSLPSNRNTFPAEVVVAMRLEGKRAEMSQTIHTKPDIDP